MANAITCVRMICSFALLFCSPLSVSSVKDKITGAPPLKKAVTSNRQLMRIRNLHPHTKKEALIYKTSFLRRRWDLNPCRTHRTLLP